MSVLVNLNELYDDCGIESESRISREKDILLVVESPEYDVRPICKSLGLSPWEVSVTWVKEKLSLEQEIDALSPELVIQVGVKPLDGYPFISGAVDVDAALRKKVLHAIPDLFVSLHHHDEYSIKDGLGTVTQLCDLLKSQRRSFCSITNHGSVGGWIKQYNACKKAGVKAIFGMEAYVSNIRDVKSVEPKVARKAYHLILIAKNMDGFQNIIRIHNDAQLNGFYYSPRANWDAIRQWGNGIIGTSACMAGEIPQALLNGDKEKAKEIYKFYASAFDEFYIELQGIEYEGQRKANKLLIEFAREVGAPLVIAVDSHYLVPQWADCHDLLMCIRQKKTLKDRVQLDDVWSFDVRNLYCRNAKQLSDLIRKGYVDKDWVKHDPFDADVEDKSAFKEAVMNTRRIALSTEDISLDDTVKLPKLYTDGEKRLREMAWAGLERLIPDALPIYKERLTHELDVITKLGWTDYFLIVELLIKEAVKRFGEWAVGYGRGSAGGSLVCYALGITYIDPIRYNLLFERFIDVSRVSCPDIDTDFDPRIRDEIKRFVVETFGADNVCSIGSYQTYKTRAVILDVARALGHDVHEAMLVTKEIDPLKSIDDESGESSKVDKMEFEDICKHYEGLRTYFEEHPDVKEHVEILRNQVKNMGKHAAGMIISDLSLRDMIPVLYDSPSERETRQVISAWAESGSQEELSSVGLVKFDILGLNNLPVISDCMKIIAETTGEQITRDQIPIDDHDAIRKEGKKDFVGIFQLENPGMRSVIHAVGIESLADIAAVTSLIRPGPRNMGMDMEYARRKNEGEYEALPGLRDLLGETYGILTYQEQVMLIAQKIAGFSASESYKLLKGVGKKIKSLVESFRVKFVEGCRPKIDAGEMTEKDAEDIFNLIESFAGYGFNRCLSLDSVLETPDGFKLLGEAVVGDLVKAPGEDEDEFVEVDGVFESEQDCFEVTFGGGQKVTCSVNHKLLCDDGIMRPLWLVLEEDRSVMCGE